MNKFSLLSLFIKIIKEFNCSQIKVDNLCIFLLRAKEKDPKTKPGLCTGISNRFQKIHTI